MPVLPAGLPGASPATGTLYPQNRFPPARLFPWKRQSDSGLWDQLENTTVSSDRLRSAGPESPCQGEGWMAAGVGRAACPPAHTLVTGTLAQRGTSCTRPWVVRQNSSPDTSETAAGSPGDASQNVTHGRQPLFSLSLPPPRDSCMHSHPENSQHQLQRLLSPAPAPLSPAQHVTLLHAMPRAVWLVEGCWRGQVAASTLRCPPAQPAAPSCSPTPPHLTTQAQKLSRRFAKQFSASDPLAKAPTFASILPLSKEFTLYNNIVATEAGKTGFWWGASTHLVAVA